MQIHNAAKILYDIHELSKSFYAVPSNFMTICQSSSQELHSGSACLVLIEDIFDIERGLTFYQE